MTTIEPRSFALQPVRGVIDLKRPTIHHVEDLVAADGLTIVTSAQQWAYALSFVVTTPRPIAGRLLIRVTGWVSSGRMGVGLVTPDGRSYLGEVFRTSQDGLTQFDLWTDSLVDGQAIVVRNAAGQASTMTIESVRVYRCFGDATVTVRWIEHRQTPVILAADGRHAAVQPAPPVGGAAGPEIAGDGDLGSRVSIILTVKNGMPYLPAAIDSVRAQRYRNFELIVQDGGSTDGTLDYLRTIDDIPMSLVSEPDSGIGEARHRAYARCRTDLIGSIDADNLLKPDALSTAVAVFRDHPEAAALYAAVEIIDHDGRFNSCFVPPEFDLLKVAACELVPPWSTTFFSRRVCGADLFFDPAIAGCVDYDSWLRLGHRPILQVDRVLGCTRLNSRSVSCRIENYDVFCREKITALEQYLRRHDLGALGLGVLRHGIAGIYCWAAESLERLGASGADIERYVDLARQTDPASERAGRVLSRAPR
jgi:glycosyltransferase